MVRRSKAGTGLPRIKGLDAPAWRQGAGNEGTRAYVPMGPLGRSPTSQNEGPDPLGILGKRLCAHVPTCPRLDGGRYGIREGPTLTSASDA